MFQNSSFLRQILQTIHTDADSMMKSLWNCLLVATSQISPDVNILVTNKRCPFSH